MKANVIASVIGLGLMACAASSNAASAPAAAGAATPQLPGANNDKRAFEIADFYRCAVVSAPSVSKDGKHVAFSVRRYELEAAKSWSEIWMMNSDGANLHAMTGGKHNDANPSFSPDGRTLLFTSDRSGDAQLWTIPVDGGESAQLTKFGPGLGDPLWSPDGKYIAATADLFPECGLDEDCNKKNSDGLEEGKLKVHVADDLLYRHWTSWRDGRRSHIVLVDAASGKVVKDLTPGDFESPVFSLGDRGFAFSPDGKELCYVSNHDSDPASSTNGDLWTVPVDGEIKADTAKNLTRENRGFDGAPLYSPDGRYIAYVSQATPAYESDLKRLAVYDRQQKSVRYLTDRASFDNWVDDLRWAPDSSSIVFNAEYRGRNPLFRISLSGGKPQQVLEHAFLAGWELSADGKSAIYTRRSIHEPAEVYSASLAGAKPTRLTTINQAIENEVDIRPPTEYWFQGDGDYKVHCFVVTPHGFDPSKKYPLILNVHGGPQSQWEDSFRGDWQVYPGKGYIVAFCNPTGSTGYGQDFTDAISGDWGGRVFRDLMKVTDQLEQLPFVDKERVGAMGWSYGGYMSMWIEGHTNRFKCNAAMMGVYDLTLEYGATEELWFPEHDLRGTPWTSDDFVRWSPNQYVKNFKTPALVITGEKDYRVPYTQSLEYHTGLRKMGVPARLVVFPGAGHWPSWYEMAFYYNAHLDFFHKWLGGGDAPWNVTEFSRNLTFKKK